MGTKIKRIESRGADEVLGRSTNTYLVVEGDKEFIIKYTFHPHHGTKLTLAGEEGTLHMQAEDNAVVRQMVALGGGCALAIREEVVDGLSPASLLAVIAAERSGEMDKAE